MTVDPDHDRMMPVPEVAKFFGVTPWTIRQWISNGSMKAIKINSTWRILKSEVVRYATERFGE